MLPHPLHTMNRFSRLHPLLLPGIILAVGFTTTAILWSLTEAHARQARELDVEFLAAQVANRIEDHLQDNVQLLRGVAGLFDTPEWITRERFHRYVKALQLGDEYPGIQGIGFLLLIPDDEKDAWVAAVQREGFAPFQIYPAGERAFYAVVLYLEPFNDRNARAIGYDMAPEPLRWTAATRARDQAAVALSAQVTLVSEDASNIQPGFMLFLPIYRADTPHDTLAERRMTPWPSGARICSAGPLRRCGCAT